MDLDEALGELVAHSGDRLLRVAYQLTHDRAAAQDLVQDALVRVYRSMRRRGVPPGDWYAYLRRAVVNEYLRARRLRSSGEVVTDRMPERPVAGSPEDQIADRAQLWAALGALSARQRAALVLRYYEDLPDHQIAVLLGCREASVRSLASRGLAVLRQRACPPPQAWEEPPVSGIEDILRQVMASHDQGDAGRTGPAPRPQGHARASQRAREVVWPARAPGRRRRGHRRGRRLAGHRCRVPRQRPPGWPRPGRAVRPYPRRRCVRHHCVRQRWARFPATSPR